MSAPRRDVRALAERVLRLEAEAILGVIPKLGESFERAVDLLRTCTGRVIVTGIGKSGHVGGKIAATLASTGTPAYFLHPAEHALARRTVASHHLAPHQGVDLALPRRLRRGLRRVPQMVRAVGTPDRHFGIWVGIRAGQLPWVYG